MPESETAEETAQRVVAALGRVKMRQAGYDEGTLQDEIEREFASSGFDFRREAKIGPKCRPDFMVSGVVVEVKKGRPDRRAVERQLERYAACPEAEALVLVIERSMPLPEAIRDKPVHVVSVNANWGIAI